MTEEVKTAEDSLEALETAEVVEAPEVQEPEDKPDFEADARRLGWKPKEEWKGDDSGWVDAEAYVERFRNTPQNIARLERQLKEQEEAQARSLRAMEALMKQQKDAEIARVKAQLSRARENLDVDAVARLSAEQARLEAQQPKEQPQANREIEAYVQSDEGQWLRDPVIRAMGAELIEQNPAAKMLPPLEQARYARMKLEMQMPHLFGGQQAQPSRPRANLVDGGAPVQPTRRARGWNEMPAAERQMMARMIEDGTFKDQAAAAKAYWEEYGNA